MIFQGDVLFRLNRKECPMCGGDARVLASVRTIDPDSSEEVDLRECRHCRHWWHSPVPDRDELIRMYSTASSAVVDSGARESYASKVYIDYFQTRVLSATAGAPRSNYLEIGPGGGHLLRRLREKGHVCFGVDPGQWTSDPWILPSLEQIPPAIVFDGFILQDVIEHLFDPIETLVALRRKAGPSAALFCSFPCNESRPARRYRERWAMVRPFGHMHYFSLQSSSEMLHRSGWSVVATKLTRTTPLRWSLRNRDLRAVAYELVKGGRDQLHVSAIAR